MSIGALMQDEIVRARFDFWAWLLVGAFLNWGLGWQNWLPWVSFMSWYAIVSTASTKINAARAAQAALSEDD